jgi:hypothetical protein
VILALNSTCDHAEEIRHDEHDAIPTSPGRLGSRPTRACPAADVLVVSGFGDIPRPASAAARRAAATADLDQSPVELISPAAALGDRPTTATRADTGKAIRASDAEREDTVRRLHHALGEGRLNLQETETRVAAVYTAVYRGELPELLGDLPEQRSTTEALLDQTEAPSWQTLWIALVWRARVSLWDGPGRPRHCAPGRGERRLAALLLALAGLWLLVCAVIGAVL